MANTIGLFNNTISCSAMPRRRTIRHSQKRWAEAEIFLHGAAEFAVLMRDPEQRLRCWKLLGAAQYQQAKTEAAFKTWCDGAIVAGKLKRDKEHQEFLKLVREHYAQSRDEHGLRTALKRIQDALVAQSQPADAAR